MKYFTVVCLELGGAGVPAPSGGKRLFILFTLISHFEVFTFFMLLPLLKRKWIYIKHVKNIYM